MPPVQSNEDRDLADRKRRRLAASEDSGEFDEETTGVRNARGIDRVEKSVKRVKFWIAGVAIPAIAGLVLAVKFLMSYARESERAAILREIDHDRTVVHDKQISEILIRIRELELTARRNEARTDRRRDADGVSTPPPHDKVTP